MPNGRRPTTFDPIRAYGTAAAIRGQQTRNTLLQRQLEETQRGGERQQKMDAASEKAAQEQFLRTYLPNVNDQATYDIFKRRYAMRWLDDAARLPREYDPDEVKSLKEFFKVPVKAEEYTLKPGEKRFKGREEIADVEPKGPKAGWIEMTHPEKGRKTKVREGKVEEFKKRGWVRGVPLEGKAGPGTTKKLTDYKSAINQTLKKYGIESGLIIKPDGTIDIEAYLSGKDSVYQALQKKAAKGDIRAAGDLGKINYWYSKIDELTGVPKEILGRPEEERQLDATDPFRIR